MFRQIRYPEVHPLESRNEKDNYLARPRRSDNQNGEGVNGARVRCESIAGKGRAGRTDDGCFDCLA